MVKREEINIFDLRRAMELQKETRGEIVVEEGKLYIEYDTADGWRLTSSGRCLQRGHDKEEIVMAVLMVTGGNRRK
jgi:hypothetical protein